MRLDEMFVIPAGRRGKYDRGVLGITLGSAAEGRNGEFGAKGGTDTQRPESRCSNMSSDGEFPEKREESAGMMLLTTGMLGPTWDPGPAAASRLKSGLPRQEANAFAPGGEAGASLRSCAHCSFSAPKLN